jgi:hypothetical protein
MLDARAACWMHCTLDAHPRTTSPHSLCGQSLIKASARANPHQSVAATQEGALDLLRENKQVKGELDAALHQLRSSKEELDEVRRVHEAQIKVVVWGLGFRV